jgi:hypothetical protein
MKRLRLTAILFVMVTAPGIGIIKDASLLLVEYGHQEKK